VSAVEAPPAREVLAESRTLKGGGAAGVVATVGAAGVEVALPAGAALTDMLGECAVMRDRARACRAR